MAGAGYQQVGQSIRAPRPTGPRGPTNMARREAPYQQAMGARNMPNQVMRPVVPAPQPQRAAYKLTANTRNQYPAVIPQQQQQPDPSAAGIPGQEPLTASLLATASASEQKQMIGERLFPLLQEHQPHLAGKITGMLLEIDNSELLNMLESRDLLAAKVDEAVQVLQAHQAKEAAAAAAAATGAKI